MGVTITVMAFDRGKDSRTMVLRTSIPRARPASNEAFDAEFMLTLSRDRPKLRPPSNRNRPAFKQSNHGLFNTGLKKREGVRLLRFEMGIRPHGN